MRFLAVQEDGYGVGLVQNRLPNYADENMMAAAADTEPDKLPRVEEGSMISNLPLLFANGYPTSLEKISLKQLERFITFMVQCSLGHDTAEVISEPKWWPKEVKFSNPLIRPKNINDSWMANLKKLVYRCYTYHRSDYLLEFCTYLSSHSHDKLYYVNNWDSTTSLYHKGTGKLLVTFRNENMNYDKSVESPRRSLLPQHGSLSGFANKSKQPQPQQQRTPSLMVIQPPSDEIYLCDNCDAEFIGLEKMKDHEKTCGEHVENRSVSRSETPTEAPIQEELAQNQFLEYFSLYSDPPACKPAVAQKTVISYPPIISDNRGSRRHRGSVNLTRCPSIPFSSPAGIAMAKNSKMLTEVTQQERLERIERHMHAPALGKSVRPKWLDRLVEYNRWVVTYKPNRDKLLEEHHKNYTHRYKFNSRTNKPVLSVRSQLLYIACKPIYVALERLGPEGLAELKRDPSKYSSPRRHIISQRRSRPRPGPLIKSRVEQRLNTRPAHSRSSLKRKFSVEKLVVNAGNVIRKEELVNGAETVAASRIIRSQLESEPRQLDDFAEITVIGESPRQNSSKTLQSETSKKNIVVVDLCSSDEEIESPPRISSDENRDPMRSSMNMRTNFAKNQALNKFRTKTCVHPADSTSDWVRDNVLTDDNDKFGNKCLGNVVLDTCTQFPPSFKPAP